MMSKTGTTDLGDFRKLIQYTAEVKQEYKALYEGFPDLLRTINYQGIIVNCNQKYASALGYTKNELIGTSIFDTVAKRSISAMRKSFETWKKTGSVHNRQIWFKRKNGTIFPTFISASNLYDMDGNMIGSNSTIRDISEIYSQKEKLKKLKKTHKQKEKFGSMISHDLKLLLHPISGYCKMLKDPKILGTLNTEQLDAVNEIFANSKKLETLISDIHETLKLEINQIMLEERSINVSDMLNMVSGACRPFVVEKKIKINFNSPEKELCIIGDVNRVFQVFMNLINNAVSFLPKKDGRIDVNTLTQSNFVIFHIHDNGIGITKEKQKKIFHEFYQANVVSEDKHRGSGLGLAICKGLIKKMRGKIWVESTVGEGTTISFSLPKEESQ